MKLSLAIVAHPDRKEHVTILEEQLNPEVILWDDQGLGCEKNHMRAWEWLSGSGSDWSICIEDDAVPCQNFTQQLEMALRASPSPVVGLYLGRGRPLTVDGFDWPNRIAAGITRDVCWLTASGMANCVGVAIRTELLPAMLRAVPFLIKYRPIDQAIGIWALSQGIDVAYTRPSLVDHRGLPTVISVEDRVDGQERDGLTQTGYTPEGKLLPELRKAWLFEMQPSRRNWDSTLHAL